MPTYVYRCEDCEGKFERFLRLKDRKDPQPCEHCKSSNTHTIITSCNFVLKGDGWPGKNYRINNQMAEKNRRLDIKQEERKRDAPGMTLAPNVGGERVDSWSEAQKLAASKGKNTQSYEPLIRSEKSK